MTSSCSKKTLCLVRQRLLQVEGDIVVCWVSFLSLPSPLHTVTSKTVAMFGYFGVSDV